MKKNLLVAVASVFMIAQGHAQTEKLWSSFKGDDNIALSKNVQRETFPQDFKLFQLDLAPLKQTLRNSPDRLTARTSGVIISLPNASGKMERFEMFEASNFEPELQAQFPDIRSYVGVGLDDKYAQVRMSLDPRGIQTMVFRADKKTEFMEPYSADGKVYAVFTSNRQKGKLPFTCSTPEQVLTNELSNQAASVSRSSTGQLLNFRLALSCTGEYANYFGATSSAQVAAVNAAYNATMTRVNGVFEKDFAIHMNIVASNNNVIYYNPGTDPYSDAANMNNWNNELQTTLTSVIGNANYDVGHLFGASGGGGNAGCIGCVCNTGKGSGYTSPADGIPAGDNFDIDYVAHELGHQFGANHTFSMSNEGSGVNVEPGSGVTVMGYAGITAQDVASHSIDIFHASSIAQVQTNMASKSCPTTVAITHGTPVVNGGADYTIPKSTPFMLTGSATDSGGGALTYCWEQVDNASALQTGANSAASATKTTGPNWRTYPASASPTRYFPIMSSIMNGQTTTAGNAIDVEALSSVARTLNFRLTVRDNVAGQGQTNFDNVAVTVDATRGPLTVTSQNTDGITWNPGETQTITWAVNNTNTSTGGANVDILLSTDNGATFSTVLLANTPNDGSETITVPSSLAPYCRVMVKASGSIFFNVNVKNIAIGYIVNTTTTCTNYTRTFSPPIAMATGWTAYNLPSAAGITDSYTISDANLTLVSTAARTNQVSFGLVKPGSTVVDYVAFDGPSSGCNNSVADLNVVFDDEGAVFSCANTNSGASYKPVSSFSTLDGLNSAGVWRLAAKSTNTANTISSATLTLCQTNTTITLSSENFGLENFSIYPNPNKGTFNVQFTSNSSNEIKIGVHDMRGRLVFENDFQNTGTFNQKVALSNVQTGIYVVTVQDGERKEVKKIVIE